MPLTRSELACLATGIAIGAVGGANMDKLKTTLKGLTGAVSEGLGDGFAGFAQKFAEHVEAMQDAMAEKAAAAQASAGATTTTVDAAGSPAVPVTSSAA
jgi:hypothetical protein